MSDPMQEIRNSFFIECEELLESLQDALQSMEDGDTSSETINVAFRAVHSIKGGAGAFGLDQLVAFAHTFETVMDNVRSDKLALDPEIVQLFFQCGDMLSDLVRVCREGELLPEETIEPLASRLRALSGEEAGGAAAEEEVVDFQPAGISIDLPDLGGDDEDSSEPEDASEPQEADATETGGRRFEVTFVPEPELYRTGNEPLLLLRELSELGTAETSCSHSELPDLGAYVPSASHLSWKVVLVTDEDEDAITEVFDFVDGACKLEIVELGGSDGNTEESNGSTESPTPPSDSTETPSDLEPAAEPPAETKEEPVPETSPPSGSKPEPKNEPPSTKASSGSEQSASESGKAQAGGASSGGSAQSGATVRVDLDRVDRLVNLVGELVINQAMLSQSIAATGLSGNSKIATGLDEFQQLTRDIQDSVMMIRAQPVKSLFQRMGRIVREASASVNKTVRLKTEGESTEIDKTVIERLADPLTHMIRNAVDHGLESTEMRLAAGKPAEGYVTLSASHRSGRVVIEIADDGGGINRERVKSIAEEKGLIPPGQDLSESEIDGLLFLPGFSTAKEVSNLSGRGVGMDVVKNAISALGGRISIASHAGKGTTFSISLPLTLAVLDGMVVTVAEETLVLPLSSVSETLTIGKEDVRGLGPSTQVIRVRDVFVPLIDLGTELGYSTPREQYEGAIVLLISQEDGKRAALVVDGIEDQRQVVIKGLEESYGRVPGVAAATILGDGQIALILDPTDLLANASGRSRKEPSLALVENG